MLQVLDLYYLHRPLLLWLSLLYLHDLTGFHSPSNWLKQQSLWLLLWKYSVRISAGTSAIVVHFVGFLDLRRSYVATKYKMTDCIAILCISLFTNHPSIQYIRLQPPTASLNVHTTDKEIWSHSVMLFPVLSFFLFWRARPRIKVQSTPAVSSKLWISSVVSGKLLACTLK